MDLRTTLRAVESLDDLPKLIVQLGHLPTWEQVPAEAWGRGGNRVFYVTAVGQSGDIPWLGVTSRAADRDAVALARRIQKRGRTAMVLAIDPARRRLAVTVTYDRCPCVTLDLDRPDEESVASLARLAGAADGGSYAYLARAADALAAEPVSRRFFRQFRATLDQMMARMPGQIPLEDRHALILLQLTRVLFLYFIQAKGWLAGQNRFLAHQVDLCLSRQRRIQRDLLRPLFFGTLNRPLDARTNAARRFGSIPFLNGGLFEPHPLERHYPSDIPNDLWRDAFDGLFERFHFTVSESGTGSSVAPDMLGRVFEGVMAPARRKVTGAFYTPAGLVDQLLEAALIGLLTIRLRCTEAVAERRLAEPDAATRKTISRITVLDPAAGSGGFLLRVLERLAVLGSPSSSAAERKRQVLRRSLFGVDSNASAVRLSELRLWLAVIADETAERPEQVVPLPNLDCLIRQGDSLFEPPGLSSCSSVLRPCPDAARSLELSELRQEIINATGTRKRALVRRLRECEARELACALSLAESKTQSAITDCMVQARTGDLFGNSRGLDRELRDQLRTLRGSLQELRQARRRLRREGEVPWFHYESHFADVFARGGFDLVIGNPPWLRSELIPPKVRIRLAGRYRWWRRGNRLYGNSPDLAVAFLERALELARSRGVVAMLVPAKISAAGYGAPVRHGLATETTLQVIADLTGSHNSAFDATVYPLALITAKSPPPRHHRVRTALERGKGGRLVQSELSGGAPWILVGTGTSRLLSRLERDHPALGDSISCHLGVKTGLNRVFLNPPPDVEAEVLRWALRGRDVRPFGFRRKLRLLWTHDTAGHPATRLPAKAEAYLKSHEDMLRARRDYQRGPSWTLFRVRPATAPFRVVWPDLSQRLIAVALTSARELECVPLNSCYVAPASSGDQAEILTAWLNSSWIDAIARLGAMPASGGFARFNAQVVSHLPLPASVWADSELKRLARLGSTGAPVQDELDRRAATHLALSSYSQRALRQLLADRPNHRR